MTPMPSAAVGYILLLLDLLLGRSQCINLRSTTFLGSSAGVLPGAATAPRPHRGHRGVGESLTMRKQKASDKRTRRLQRGGIQEATVPSLSSSSSSSYVVSSPDLSQGSVLTSSSPMAASAWTHKSVMANPKLVSGANSRTTGGRGRARKRAAVYASVSSYHNEFLGLLTAEYRAEEAEVLSRLDSSLEDPLRLEVAGHALFDLYPERRGNIFQDEVYRLSKARDATTCVVDGTSGEAKNFSDLPPNHKFSSNDVIMLTLQPAGSGDFFGTRTLPTHPESVSVEARVLNTGPTYVDIAIPGGTFESAFGPAPNNQGPSGRGDRSMRLRADRFFSNVPYMRMVAALAKLTSLPENKGSNSVGKSDSAASQPIAKDTQNGRGGDSSASLHLDPLLREVILSTFAYSDPSNPFYEDPSSCDVNDIARRIAKPPLAKSQAMASQVLKFLRSKPGNGFRDFNEPQLTAIGAALTRRVTLIQGPPGTGKTTVAGAIAFGFVHQCRNLSPQAKVLACAFSNVGADNLAEQALKLGLNVVRVGKASCVAEGLWDHTLDAAIARDPDAQKALDDAARATSLVSQQKKRGGGRSSGNGDKDRASRDKFHRDMATTAVKASIEACRVAATKALREADIIVSTSVGAADPRLLAACGILPEEDPSFEEDSRLKDKSWKKRGSLDRLPLAPDGLPPLSLPFVIVDEACQSVEPANLVPVTATDSCRALVLLGDPCQLPPTVKTDSSGMSPLSVSLMSRLSTTLPSPVIVTARADATECDSIYLNAKPTRQAISLMNYRKKASGRKTSYRKNFAGSLLLSVQYRMHPSISAFPSAVFYDGLLSTPAFLSYLRPFPSSLDLDCDTSVGVRFVDVPGRNNEKRGEAVATGALGENFSFSNKAEAIRTVGILKQIFKNCKTAADAPKSIGIVTPYTAQRALISSMISADKEFLELTKHAPTTIEIKSVDGYQGREMDIILFSAVRSNRSGSLGFLTDWRRMNVALTRARSGLVVVGDYDTLKEGDVHWEAFCNWCDSVGCIK